MSCEHKPSLGEQAYAKAMQYELNYGCCPQCVLATVQESVGIVDDQTIKASHGLSGGVTCKELQRQFTGRTYDMWNAVEYSAFDAARGKQCAHATGTVTKWVVEMF